MIKNLTRKLNGVFRKDALSYCLVQTISQGVPMGVGDTLTGFHLLQRLDQHRSLLHLRISGEHLSCQDCIMRLVVSAI